MQRVRKRLAKKEARRQAKIAALQAKMARKINAIIVKLKLSEHTSGSRHYALEAVACYYHIFSLLLYQCMHIRLDAANK